MSFKELAPISNRLSSTSMRLPGSAASQIACSLPSSSEPETWEPVCALAQRRELGQIRSNSPSTIGLLQKMPLHLAAGGLRDALDRNDLRHLDAGVLVDQTADGAGGRHEFLESAPVQDEYHELLALGPRFCHAGGHHLVEVEPRRALRDVLQIVGVVVLPVDEDDFLAAAGDVEIALVHHAEIAGIEPAIRAEDERGRLRIAEIALSDVRSADQYVADLAGRHGRARIVRDADLHVGKTPADAHQFDHVPRVDGVDLDGRAEAELVPVDSNPAVIRCRARKRDGETGLRQAVDRIHRALAKPGVRERLHELVAERHRDRLGAVVDRADARQIDALELAVAEHFEESAGSRNSGSR